MTILYEDNHLIAVNKAAGEIVQGDKTGDEPLSKKLQTWLKEKYKKPGNAFIGVIHRLDRPTSGVVLFAKTSKALSRMNQQFRERADIGKLYWAVVQGKPGESEGRLEDYLWRNREKNKSFSVKSSREGAKKAALTYRVLAESNRYTLLEITLLTGRHHQIRAQLSTRGLPIKGDLKYGYPRANPDGGIHLHARHLEFNHPVTKQRTIIEAPVPRNDKVWQILGDLTRKQ